MHFVEAKGILSSKNGMNIYRGCLHGCIYCDTRSTCYQINHAFEDIEVKINAPELLEKALRRKRHKCMIGTGSMSDPYMPIEKDLQLTRRCLEVIEKYGFGVTLITKSDLVLRDLDLLKKINEKSKCVVQMTLTTYDETLSHILEPNVCTTKRRIEVLNVLKEHGIPTVVWLSPILPYINDSKENIKHILDACVKAEVKGIICFSMGLTLREGNREYYYQKLDEHFLGLRQIYEKQYKNAYQVSSPKNKELMDYFYRICQAHHIISDVDQCFAYLHEFPQTYQQLTLF